MKYLTYSYQYWFIEYRMYFAKKKYFLFVEKEDDFLERIVFTGNSFSEVFLKFTNWFETIVKNGNVIQLLRYGFPVYIEEEIMFNFNDKPFGFMLAPSYLSHQQDVLLYNKIPSFLSEEGFIVMGKLPNFFLLEPYLIDSLKLFAIFFNYKDVSIHSQSIRNKELFASYKKELIRQEYFQHSLSYEQYLKQEDRNLYSKYLFDEIYIPSTHSVKNILYLGEWKNQHFYPTKKFYSFVKPSFQSLLYSLY